MATARVPLGFTYTRHTDWRHIVLVHEGEPYGISFYGVLDLGWRMEQIGFPYEQIGDTCAMVRDLMLEEGRDRTDVTEVEGRQESAQGAPGVFIDRWRFTLGVLLGAAIVWWRCVR